MLILNIAKMFTYQLPSRLPQLTASWRWVVLLWSGHIKVINSLNKGPLVYTSSADFDHVGSCPVITNLVPNHHKQSKNKRGVFCDFCDHTPLFCHLLWSCTCLRSFCSGKKPGHKNNELILILSGYFVRGGHAVKSCSKESCSCHCDLWPYWLWQVSEKIMIAAIDMCNVLCLA